jgi:hypothetical protein
MASTTPIIAPPYHVQSAAAEIRFVYTVEAAHIISLRCNGNA